MEFNEPPMTACELKTKLKIVTESSGGEKAKILCGRIYSDFWTLKPQDGEETIPMNNWHMMVDEETVYKISIFIRQEVVGASMCSISEVEIGQQACQDCLTR